MPAPPFDHTRAVSTAFLDSPPAHRVREALEAAGVSGNALTGVLHSYRSDRAWPVPVARVFDALNTDPQMAASFAPLRFLLVSAALDALDRLRATRISPEVQTLMCGEFRFFAEPEEDWLHTFETGSNTSIAFAELALLERFSAGQLHWTVSGIPRSWMLRVPPRDYLRVLKALIRMGGFRPGMFIHITPPRSYLPVLLERESLRSYQRMAESMELQPEVRGIITASWLHSEDTLRISPHLGWMNRIILENGGTVSHIGYSDPNAGFLVGSPERQRLYNEGKYRPRDGLVIWPRHAVLDWLARRRAASAVRKSPAGSASS
jgi:hypothetical protein